MKDDEIWELNPRWQKFNFRSSQLTCYAISNLSSWMSWRCFCNPLSHYWLLPDLMLQVSLFYCFSHFKTWGQVFSNQRRMMKNKERILGVTWSVRGIIIVNQELLLKTLDKIEEIISHKEWYFIYFRLVYFLIYLFIFFLFLFRASYINSPH